MNIPYDPNLERPEALGRNNLRILQPIRGFRFGQDSLLLAYFAARHCKHKVTYRVVDFCAGSGVVGLIFVSRLKGKSFHLQGIEWHPATAERLSKNYTLNYPEQTEAWCGDITAPEETWHRLALEKVSLENVPLENAPLENVPHEAADQLCIKKINATFLSKSKKADIILCNPPYAPLHSGLMSCEAPWARAEIVGDLQGYLTKAAHFLVPGGELYLCHRAERLPEILYYLEDLELRPKLLRFTQSNPNAKPKLVLLKATQFEKKGGFSILPPLYTGASPWNGELLSMYGEEERMSEAALYRGLVASSPVTSLSE